MRSLLQRIYCYFDYHDLVYLPSPLGFMGGVFAPCVCRYCGYKFNGFLRPNFREEDDMLLGEQVKNKREGLENSIKKLTEDFTRETGFDIEYVHLQQRLGIDKERSSSIRVYDINIRLSI